MKKIFILALFLVTYVFFNVMPSPASASCTPSSTYVLTNISSVYSYKNLSNGSCTNVSGGNYSNVYSGTTPTTTNGQSAVVNCGSTGAGLVYYASAGCSGTVRGYSGGACQTQTVTCTSVTSGPTATKTPSPTGTSGSGSCNLNGVSVANGSQFCVGDSWPANGAHIGTAYCAAPATHSYETCVNGVWNTSSCGGNYCGYYSQYNVSCFAACGPSTTTVTSGPTTTGTITVSPSPTPAAPPGWVLVHVFDDSSHYSGVSSGNPSLSGVSVTVSGHTAAWNSTYGAYAYNIGTATTATSVSVSVIPPLGYTVDPADCSNKVGATYPMGTTTNVGLSSNKSAAVDFGFVTPPSSVAVGSGNMTITGSLMIDPGTGVLSTFRPYRIADFTFQGSGTSLLHVETDKNGKYALTGIPPSEYGYSLSSSMPAGGYVSETTIVNGVDLKAAYNPINIAFVAEPSNLNQSLNINISTGVVFFKGYNILYVDPSKASTVDIMYVMNDTYASPSHYTCGTGPGGVPMCTNEGTGTGLYGNLTCENTCQPFDGGAGGDYFTWVYPNGGAYMAPAGGPGTPLTLIQCGPNHWYPAPGGNSSAIVPPQSTCTPTSSNLVSCTPSTCTASSSLDCSGTGTQVCTCNVVGGTGTYISNYSCTGASTTCSDPSLTCVSGKCVNPNLTPTVTSAPTVTTGPTATTNPSITAGPTTTAAPTVTAAPTSSPTPTPTFAPGDTIFNFSVGLDGIGTAGDHVSPTNSTGSNKSPHHPARNIVVNVYNTNNTTNAVLTKFGNINYDSTSGRFIGSVDMGNTLTSGSYIIKIMSNGFLTKSIPGAPSIVAGQTFTVPNVNLVNGDVNSDNKLDITDFNILTSCWIYSTNSGACNANSQFSITSDLNDDGVIDQTDYNLFLREYSVQNGD